MVELAVDEEAARRAATIEMLRQMEAETLAVEGDDTRDSVP